MVLIRFRGERKFAGICNENLPAAGGGKLQRRAKLETKGVVQQQPTTQKKRYPRVDSNH